MARKPAVSGQFYTGNEKALKKELLSLTSQKKDKINALGAVSPHAGYMYSGAVAGEVLSSIKPKPAYIILGPNHTGLGKPLGLDAVRNWQTPLGEARIDKELCKAILDVSKFIKQDGLSHDREHSIEVQLPFLQYLNRDFTFVPISVSLGERGLYANIGKELATAVKQSKKEVTIIASSDMTHYEPQQEAKKKDMLAIDRILKLDVAGFLSTIEKYGISMCGFEPAAIMMEACLELGAKKAKLIKYATSGDTTGDYSAVVGYAGIVIY